MLVLGLRLYTRLRRVRFSSFLHIWRLLLLNIALKGEECPLCVRDVQPVNFDPFMDTKPESNVIVTFALTKKKQQTNKQKKKTTDHCRVRIRLIR